MTEPVQQEHRTSARHTAAILTPRGAQCPPCVPSPTCPTTATHISALLRFRASVMISCSRTETSSAGVAVKGQGPPARQRCPLIPHSCNESRGQGLAQGPGRRSGRHRGLGDVWGMCTCEQHIHACSSAHTQLHTCTRVSKSPMVMLHACMQPCSISACLVLCQLISPFCYHSPARGQGSRWLGTETPLPPPSRAGGGGWSSIPHSTPSPGVLHSAPTQVGEEVLGHLQQGLRGQRECH